MRPGGSFVRALHVHQTLHGIAFPIPSGCLPMVEIHDRFRFFLGVVATVHDTLSGSLPSCFIQRGDHCYECRERLGVPVFMMIFQVLQHQIPAMRCYERYEEVLKGVEKRRDQVLFKPGSKSLSLMASVKNLQGLF